TNGCLIIVSRTYAATNVCGESSFCTQTITVIDTTPPVFAGISNLTFECGAPWDFQVPTATDVCSGTNVTIIASTPLTNALCGGTFTATQVWQAMDACSNVSYFLQTVTIVDTTPPVIICATNRTVECGSA